VAVDLWGAKGGKGHGRLVTSGEGFYDPLLAEPIELRGKEKVPRGRAMGNRFISSLRIGEIEKKKIEARAAGLEIIFGPSVSSGFPNWPKGELSSL